MAIDVGTAAEDRGSYSVLGTTRVLTDNPANDTGTINHIDVWFNTGGATGDCDFASFTDEGSDTLSTNGVAQTITIATGDNNFDAPGDFTAFNISTGEYIGIYGPSDVRLELDSGSGDVTYYKSSDQIPCSSVEFTSTVVRAYSLYATGTESEAGAAGAMSTNTGYWGPTI